MVDTFDLVAPLAWLYTAFLPRLPAGALLVLASRTVAVLPASAAPGWEGLVRTLRLRNFEAVESDALLERRGVLPAERSGLIAVTYGHPLALSIAADVRAQSSGLGPLERVELLRTLSTACSIPCRASGTGWRSNWLRMFG